jgi:[pyruvate, water dikinase]-phosphate phosphotransferase / [pyruvate, water dikinase] kinase
MSNYYILLISDGTGETAYRLLKAARSQFAEKVVISRYTRIRDIDQIKSMMKAVKKNQTLIVHTFASKKLRDDMVSLAEKQGVKCIDVLGPLIDQLAEVFESTPQSKPGLLHKVDEAYFDRVDAIEFAINHDDGASLKDLHKADIVIVGISRTSKTPLSIYLAQEGWRVANIPLAVGMKLPSKLSAIDQRKIVGLVTDPDRLAEARQVQMVQMGMESSSYANSERIQSEIEYAKAVFDQNPSWPVIDVTGKSIEEISQEVLDVVIGEGRSF